MNDGKGLDHLLRNNLDEINEIIDCLYLSGNTCSKNKLLNCLRKSLAQLEMLIRELEICCGQTPAQPRMPQTPQLPPPQPQMPPVRQPPLIPPQAPLIPPLQPQQAVPPQMPLVSPLFTAADLALYDGRGGFPAYVAVNGTVYDVTNSATWAAGTHFGLSAGRDLSAQFAGCHPGQPILNDLPVAGRLV